MIKSTIETISVTESISTAFISFAATDLTRSGLTGPELVKVSCAYATDFGIKIPYASYPFDALNKRTALYENLLRFAPKQQYQIIEVAPQIQTVVKVRNFG